MRTDLDSVPVTIGRHTSAADGMCVNEMASVLAGEPFSDRPACVCPVISLLVWYLTCDFHGETRQALKPYAWRILNTNTGPERTRVRAWMLIDWGVRECAPAWLRFSGLTAEAEAMEQLPQISDAAAEAAAMPTINVIKARAWRGWDAPVGQAATVATNAALDAGKACGWAAVRDTLRSCEKSAAAEAVRDIKRDTSFDAVCPIASIAWLKAFRADEDGSAIDARKAANDAALSALAPVVDHVRQSLLRLLDRLIEMDA